MVAHAFSPSRSLRRQRQVDFYEFETSLSTELVSDGWDYAEKPCLEKPKTKPNQTKPNKQTNKPPPKEPSNQPSEPNKKPWSDCEVVVFNYSTQGIQPCGACELCPEVLYSSIVTLLNQQKVRRQIWLAKIWSCPSACAVFENQIRSTSTKAFQIFKWI